MARNCGGIFSALSLYIVRCKVALGTIANPPSSALKSNVTPVDHMNSFMVRLGKGACTNSPSCGLSDSGRSVFCRYCGSSSSRSEKRRDKGAKLGSLGENRFLIEVTICDEVVTGLVELSRRMRFGAFFTTKRQKFCESYNVKESIINTI